MSESFDIRWAAVAEDDLRSIVGFIADDSLKSALEVLNRLRTGTTKLDRFPSRGRVVPELLKHGISQVRGSDLYLALEGAAVVPGPRS